MFRLAFAHWLKTKNTAVRLLCGLLPVLYAIILFFYFYTHKNLQWHAFTEYKIFFLFFSICTLFTLSVVVFLILAPDKNAENFANELRIGAARNKLFLSRFLLIFSLVIAIEGLATIIFVTLEGFFLNHYISGSLLLLFMLIPIVFLLPIILIYQLLSLRFSYVGSLLVGVLFTLSGILLGTTGLGTLVWPFFPWVWTIRFIYYEISPSDFHSIHDYWIFGVISILMTIFLMRAALFWYNKWEGNTSLED